MIARRAPFCLHPRCPNRQGSCPKHDRTVDRRPTAARRGYGHQWAAYSRAYLARPENRLCRCGCGKRSQHVDHIQAVSGPADPLFWEPSNHQPLTHGCHTRKTNRMDGGFGNPRKRL
jgi:5-methylcytosine-specific restriction enzyme A